MIETIVKDLIPVIGAGAVLIGLGATLAPSLAVKGYGVPVSGSGLAYVRGMGVRDIFLGAIILLHFFIWNPQALTVTFFGVALVSFVDFLVVVKQRSPLAVGHATGVLTGLAYGVWFLSSWN